MLAFLVIFKYMNDFFLGDVEELMFLVIEFVNNIQIIDILQRSIKSYVDIKQKIHW